MSQDATRPQYAPALPAGIPALDAAWQAAARSEALASHTSLGLSVMGQAIVLYRKADGTPVALEDRCPHRWAPLSGGRVEGDHIVCPYHGFKFCPRGQLVAVAGKAGMPGVGSAKVYPAIERDKQIWIRIGGQAPAAGPVCPQA